MSAVPNVNATGPIPAAHRTETPVWAFHHAIEVTGWAYEVAAYRLQEWEHRTVGTHPRIIVGTGVALVAIATAVIGGAL